MHINNLKNNNITSQDCVKRLLTNFGLEMDNTGFVEATNVAFLLERISRCLNEHQKLNEEYYDLITEDHKNYEQKAQELIACQSIVSDLTNGLFEDIEESKLISFPQVKTEKKLNYFLEKEEKEEDDNSNGNVLSLSKFIESKKN